MRHETEPKTLQSAIVYFANPDNCLNYLVERRWPEGVTCPTCGSDAVTFMPKRRIWQCKARHPKAQFSVKVGTIFEDSAIGLDKWLCAMWMLANCKNGVSSWEIHRSIGVTQKSAWFMLQRLRLALQDDDTGGQLSGHVEVDETYIGGKARNMHRTALARRVAEFATPRTGRNQTTGKVAVMGLLERHGEVRTMVVAGTNCLKRTIGGTYISVEPFHLFRYLDEQSFRFNNRKANDAYRFDLAVSQIVGKRLTYAEVTGKDKDARKLSC